MQADPSGSLTRRKTIYKVPSPFSILFTRVLRTSLLSSGKRRKNL